MNFEFSKFHGNGNDFVIINNIDQNIDLSARQIAQICHRRFGIGADGLILINESEHSDFDMLYHNSDGLLASMCGNGGRCTAAFAKSNGIASSEMIFNAYDGLHKAIVNNTSDESSVFDISLQMSDVKNVEINEDYYFLDTGSPHYVEFVDHVAEFDVVKHGKITRNSEKFHPHGTNVNFVELSEDRIFVRTYERGVEDETLSCGTGVTASAIASYFKSGKSDVIIHTPGGDFRVWFKVENGIVSAIWLRGAAIEVFKGVYNLD